MEQSVASRLCVLLAVTGRPKAVAQRGAKCRVQNCPPVPCSAIVIYDYCACPPNFARFTPVRGAFTPRRGEGAAFLGLSCVFWGMKAILPLVSLLLCAARLYGQTPAPPPKVLDKLYVGTLDRVLREISRDAGVAIMFDSVSMARIEYTYRFFKTPVEEGIKELCRTSKLKYTLDAMGRYTILTRLEEIEAKPMTATRAYFGPPTRLGITVSGRVRDLTTGEALPYATITGGGSGAQSNVDGLFTLLKVASDTASLTASFPGFQRQTIFLTPELAANELIIELAPYTTEAVEVVANKQEMMQANTGISVLRMTPQKIATLPNIGEKDIMRAFQLMPGVSAANENSAGLYIRGGTPDQSLVLYDGFTVYNVDHLYGFFSAFNANAVKDAQLYKGGFGAKFGGRVNAVAELTGKDGNSKRFNLGGDLSLLSANVVAEAPIGKKMTALVAIRRSWKGPLYNKIFDKFSGSSSTTAQPGGGPMGGPGGGDFSTSVTSYFYDLNGKFTYRPSKDEVITLSLYNGTDKLDRSRDMSTPSFLASQGVNFNNSITDLTQWGNTGASLKYSRLLSEKLYFYTLGGYSHYFSTRDRTSEGSMTDVDGNETTFKRGTLEDNSLNDYSWRTDLTYKPFKGHEFQAGTDLHALDIDYTYSQNDTTTLIDRHGTGFTAAAYAQDTWSLFHNKLQLIPGIRYTWFDQTQRGYWEPRASLSAQLTKHLRLKGAWGIYNQFAKRVIREDLLQGSRDFWILADGDRLPVTNANHYIAGFSVENDGFLFDVEGYYKKLTGLSEYSLRFIPSFGEIRYNEQFFNGQGEVRGLDVLLQKKYGNYTGWISYSWCDAQNQYDVYGTNAFRASNVAQHEAKVVNTLKWKNWDFSATWIYATGKPYTAPQGGYNLTLLDGNASSYIHVSQKNGLTLPAYHRADIAATYNFKLPNLVASPGSIGFSIFNLYNRKNVWYKEFEVVDNQVIETDVNFLGITPNITLSLKIQ